jgi:hypothetical protein
MIYTIAAVKHVIIFVYPKGSCYSHNLGLHLSKVMIYIHLIARVKSFYSSKVRVILVKVHLTGKPLRMYSYKVGRDGSVTRASYSYLREWVGRT